MGVDEDAIDSLTDSCMEDEIFMTGSLEEALEFIDEVVSENEA